ncbi:MAG: type II secretion system major pseudopilin GspG [Burkholderiaceae bacterium]
MKKFSTKTSGFTLLELLIVVVIIGMLAAYVAPRYFSQLGKSETAVARSQIDALGKAIDTYRLDVGAYPTDEQGLQALIVRPADVKTWNGPYLKKDVPLDPWGRAYAYRIAGEHGDYELLSLGKDGIEGGANENQDIRN